MYHKYLSTENWEIENELRKQGSTASEAYAEIVPDVEEVVVFETRYCTVCCVEQPLRAKHCRECGKCVALHDHHCPWLGLCIGEKNRFFFWWYLFFENLLLWISEVLMGISFTDAVGWDWVIENWGKIPIIIIVSFFTFMVTCLIAYHSYLAIVNQTTWENVSWEKISYLKNSEKKRGSPFSKGIRFNLWFYCWKKYPENYTLWTVPKLAIT